jgi:hypothetical protein
VKAGDDEKEELKRRAKAQSQIACISKALSYFDNYLLTNNS